MALPMRLIAAALAFLLTAAAPPAGLTAVTVTARPVPLDPDDAKADRVGRLHFLGGVALSSTDPRFGGISGLRWRDGALLGVTDGGSWLQLVPSEENDRLTGVASAAMGMIRGPGREPLRGRGYADAEALDLESGGGMSIAFERDRRIWSYRNLADAAWSADFVDQRWLQSLPPNGGIAAMAHAANWRLFLAESPTADGRQEGVLSVNRGLDRTFARVRVPVEDSLRPTDADALDPERVVVLSRRYDPVTGHVEAVIDLVPVHARTLTLGDPERLARLRTPMAVDNLEGLALRREAGRVFVYLISDDNFSPLQRTLLLKFEVMP